ncbi:hypothetical protein L1987_31978 [Smallanthus sonchifolius]|uniref:Uncharacterized protein n=1 Tax=Smallanthus sonchifolius TaxID=185202 RepID=A0ACB9I8L2_9ASTR|nr:hypothetical protein L1987_31978 [Smallanthus sonchifolius]
MMFTGILTVTTLFLMLTGSDVQMTVGPPGDSPSRSSTESEYKTLVDTITELTWSESLLRELGVITPSSPTL